MKKINDRYFTIAVYALAVIVFLFLFGFVCFNLSPIFNGIVGAFQKLSAVVYAIIIALVLLPLVRLCETFFHWALRNKKRNKDRLVRFLSLLTSYILILVLIAAVVLSMIPSFTGAAKNTQKLIVNAVPTIRPCMPEDIVVYVADRGLIGGLVGNNTGTISQSYAQESIAGAGITEIRAGGLAGNTSGSVFSSIALDNVTARSAQTVYAGGLFGKTETVATETLPEPLRNNYRYSGQLIGLEAQTSVEQKDGEALLRNALQAHEFLADTLGWSFLSDTEPGGCWAQQEDGLPLIPFARAEDKAVSLWRGTMAAFPGSGTEEDPYRIENAEHLAYFAYYVNGGNETEGKYFRLCKDVSLYGYAWTPIGDLQTLPFRGTFDGNGHAVTDVMSSARSDAFGLFGYNEGTITSLLVSNMRINVAQTEDLVAGGIAAVNGGSITSCRVRGDLYASTSLVTVTLGTLVGVNREGGSISACSAEGLLTVVAANAEVGGLVGENAGSITASYAARDAEENILLNFFGDSVAALLASTLFSSESLSSMATQLTSNIFNLASSAIVEIVNLCLGLFISIYLLLSGKKISNVCGKILCAFFRRGTASSISLTLRHIYINLCEFSAARLLTSFLAGVGCFVLSWIFDLPMFSFIAIFLMIAHLFPIIGPILSDGVVVLVVLLLNGPQAALLYLLFLLGMEIVLTRVLSPMLLRRHLRPSFGLRTTVVLIGGGLFGVLGCFLAIPLFAALKLNFNHLLQAILRKKKLPTSPDDYDGADMTKAPFVLTEPEPDDGSTGDPPPEESATERDDTAPTDGEHAGNDFSEER